MLSSIWAVLKAGALALAWWKQKSDQDVGRRLEQNHAKDETLAAVQRSADALGDGRGYERVRQDSFRD